MKLDRPMIVVGAGRSGTTLIREALTQHKNVSAFEFEMNALWKYGNEHIDHDMLDRDHHFSPSHANYIENAFIQKCAESGRPRFLDKTVANVMRLAYVQKVLPDAKILHVIRDGRAVASSAMERWSAKHPSSYFLKKLKTVPFRSLPSLATQFVKTKFLAVSRRANYRQTWGSRWPRFDEDVATMSLAEICAKQWVMQVETAMAQKQLLKPDSYMEIRYEHLVASPQIVFNEIRCFFELDSDLAFTDWIESNVDHNRTDKWHSNLEDNQLSQILGQSSRLLKTLGYLK